MSRFRCFYCNELIKDDEVLRQHTATVHKHANIEMALYHRIRNASNRDTTVKVDVTGMACGICNQTVTKLDHLIHHLIIAHDAEYDMSVPNCVLPFKLEKSQYTCNNCDAKFVSFEFLLRHANKEHLAHDYFCHVCGMSFQGENHLRMHVRYYHKVGGHVCKECGSTFETLSKKIVHEKNVHLLNLSSCPQCPRVFKSPYLKKLHLASEHGLEDLKVKCAYCPKWYPHESIMSRHMRRVHLKEKNVECEVCKDKFFSAYDLKAHMVKHSSDKNFVCAICGKKFTSMSTLNAHALKHEAVANLGASYCPFCDKIVDSEDNSLHLPNGQCIRSEDAVVEGTEDCQVQLEFIPDSLEGEMTAEYIDDGL